MVIFPVSAHLAATSIPSVAVPLSLVARSAMMYLLGYSLDNLSADGADDFDRLRRDDAIVISENITRYIEEANRRGSALKGSEQSASRFSR